MQDGVDIGHTVIQNADVMKNTNTTETVRTPLGSRPREIMLIAPRWLSGADRTHYTFRVFEAGNARPICGYSSGRIPAKQHNGRRVLGYPAKGHEDDHQTALSNLKRFLKVRGHSSKYVHAVALEWDRREGKVLIKRRTDWAGIGGAS